MGRVRPRAARKGGSGGKNNKELADEVVVAPGEHYAGVPADEWFGMGMEVAEHRVAFPASYDADFIGVEASKEECHSAACTEGTGGDFGGIDSGMAWDRKGGNTEDAGDHGRGDSTFFSCLIEIDVQRSVGRGAVEHEVSDTAECGANRAGEEMARGSVG